MYVCPNIAVLLDGFAIKLLNTVLFSSPLALNFLLYISRALDTCVHNLLSYKAGD